MNIWKKTSYKNLKKKNITHNAFNNLIWKKKILDKININKTFLKKNYSKSVFFSKGVTLLYEKNNMNYHQVYSSYNKTKNLIKKELIKQL